MMYGRILVPIDGSDTSLRGLEEAIKLARQLNAGVRLIHVLDQRAPVVAEVSSSDVAYESEARRAAGNAVLSDGLSRARQAGVEVDGVLVESIGGPAGKYIVENATECQADLIVCGTHGRCGIRRVLLGSDAEYVLRHSPVPVLLVRCPAGET